MVYDHLRRAADWLLPDTCELCGDRGTFGLCAGCRADLPWNRPACGRCALPLPPGLADGVSCPNCMAHPPAFDRALAPLRYEGVVADLVKDLKYRAQLPMARVLGGVLANAAAQNEQRPAVLLPTPLHGHRLRERGFNQAAELTRVVARRLGLPWYTTRLRRLVDTPSQTGLDRRARSRALRQAFAWHGQWEWHSAAIIDDVITTGATAEHLARALKQVGFARVEIWAVARTPMAPGNDLQRRPVQCRDK